MKYLKVTLLVTAIICFVEVYYMHSVLSFIDYPYLYLGVVLLTLSIYLLKKRNDIN